VAARAGRPPELADILRAYSPPLEQLGSQRRRVVRDIVNCRTAVLGGHLQVCDQCGQETPVYNSCRNRHCPKCQSLDQARWVEAQARDLLPVPYFHVVFTVPVSLHPFFLANRRVAFGHLFAAALEALHDVCRSRMGALPGTIAVLHTWSQTLSFHPHIHCIVTGGGLSPARDRWIASRPNFLVPVRVLSSVFRGTLLHRLSDAVEDGSLDVREAAGRHQLREAAARKWVVYSKPPMAGPEQVLRYLGRYTHRVAISNRRIVRDENGKVTFRYRDRRHRNRQRLLTLEATDFVRRFLVHVLPRSFVRIRHYGLLANGCRTRLVAKARLLLHAPADPERDKATTVSWQDLYRRLTGREPDRCQSCGTGRLVIVIALAPVLAPAIRVRAP
jgi:putative transposase/transposase-like zinc-binding protein